MISTLFFLTFHGLLLLLGWLLSGSFYPTNWELIAQYLYCMISFGSIVGYLFFFYVEQIEDRGRFGEKK